MSKLKFLYCDASIEGFPENETKTIKNLEDLKKLDWKKVTQIDIFVGNENERFCIRITNNGIEIAYPSEIKNVLDGENFIKHLKQNLMR